jgi:hypothetical protein
VNRITFDEGSSGPISEQAGSYQIAFGHILTDKGQSTQLNAQKKHTAIWIGASVLAGT